MIRRLGFIFVAVVAALVATQFSFAQPLNRGSYLREWSRSTSVTIANHGLYLVGPNGATVADWRVQNVASGCAGSAGQVNVIQLENVDTASVACEVRMNCVSGSYLGVSDAGADCGCLLGADGGWQTDAGTIVCTRGIMNANGTYRMKVARQDCSCASESTAAILEPVR